jgi:indoleacetamide hydrolase
VFVHRSEQDGMGAALAALSACELVTRVARGELRAEDCMRAALDRHEAERALNAVSWMDSTRALEAAYALDRRRAHGAALGPLAGLPVIVKDNIAVAGTPSAAGTAALRGHVAGHDAPVVARLLEQGALFFAKANMHELAGGATSTNLAAGIVRNPYDRARVPGGSSGGTAVALAARIVPAGLGSDTAGSVRIPAALCGTAALRPTTAGVRRYAADGVVPLAAELDTIGPMARTVADLALLHTAITERSPPVSPPLQGLRLGVPRRYYWEALEPQVAAVAQDALARLQAAGMVCVEVDVSSYYALASEIYRTLLMHGIVADLPAYLAAQAVGLSAQAVIAQIASRDTRALYERAASTPITAAQVHRARRALLARCVPAYRALFAAHGIAALVFPTAPVVAPPVREHGDTAGDLLEIDGKPYSAVLTLIRNTHVTGTLGVPGLSVPAGLTAQGLPVGLELDALPDGDEALLALGIAVERTIGLLPPPPAAARR